MLNIFGFTIAGESAIRGISTNLHKVLINQEKMMGLIEETAQVVTEKTAEILSSVAGIEEDLTRLAGQIGGQLTEPQRAALLDIQGRVSAAAAAARALDDKNQAPPPADPVPNVEQPPAPAPAAPAGT